MPVNQLSKQDNVDPSFMIQIRLAACIQEKIINSMGQNFEQFYFKYFPKKCSFCNVYKFFSQFSSQTFICLLCLKSFCRDCEPARVGCLNLFVHSNQEHKGNKVYVNLENGCIYIGVNQIKEKMRLYQNNLGEKIDIYSNYKEWNQFIINPDQVKRLVTIILENQYASV